MPLFEVTTVPVKTKIVEKTWTVATKNLPNFGTKIQILDLQNFPYLTAFLKKSLIQSAHCKTNFKLEHEISRS